MSKIDYTKSDKRMIEQAANDPQAVMRQSWERPSGISMRRRHNSNDGSLAASIRAR